MLWGVWIFDKHRWVTSSIQWFFTHFTFCTVMPHYDLCVMLHGAMKERSVLPILLYIYYNIILYYIIIILLVSKQSSFCADNLWQFLFGTAFGDFAQKLLQLQQTQSLNIGETELHLFYQMSFACTDRTNWLLKLIMVLTLSDSHISVLCCFKLWI